MAILLKLQLLGTKWAVINQQHRRKGMISESLQRYCKQFVREECPIRNAFSFKRN